MCWGPDNREAAVRVPSTFWGREMATANLEYKPIDASCNPYLALGGLIAAGVDGIDRRLAPPEPISVDPHRLSSEERDALHIAPYPVTVGHALDVEHQVTYTRVGHCRWFPSRVSARHGR